MSSPESIFISYRREDSRAETKRIYDRLVAEFGREHVFKVDDIPLGIDFAEYLDQAVNRCQVVLVMIGKIWLTITEKDGTRHLDNPDDFVRLEIESALRRGIPVIPVLLQGAVMPRRNQLPASLQPLARRSGLNVSYGPNLQADMSRLVQGLRKVLDKSISGEIPVKAKGNGQDSAYIPPPPKYDLRGAQFGGGFAETVKGNQVGGTINNKTSKTPVFFSEKLGGGVLLDMMHIPKGSFWMGSPKDEPIHRKNQLPQHRVKMPAFCMGRYLITQRQWSVVSALNKIDRELSSNPSKFKGDNLPVERVSWFDAVEFCNRLSKHTGKKYRLPSEAEWEYACRAGTTTLFYFDFPYTNTHFANFDHRIKTYYYSPGPDYKKIYTRVGNFIDQTTPVDKFPANSFGLYDLHGNVREWCQDCWHSSYDKAPKDGSAWLDRDDSGYRVTRGGSWLNKIRESYSAYRDSHYTADRKPTIGFRVVCSVPRSLQ